ncbi:hypothetical protein TNCV_2921091 [Trichonephila clavipes]|nr:hypothetical protein TNCV_2921091 [Trichonephila clavipes]
MFMYLTFVCLPSRNSWALLPGMQNMPHIKILPSDPCTVRVRQVRFITSWSSRQVLRHPSVQIKGQRGSPDHILPIFNPQICPVSSSLTPLQTKSCISGSNEWFFDRHLTLCIPILCNSLHMVQAEICWEEPPWLTICIS